MNAPKPSFRPRLSGAGFNQGFGEVNEHLDQQATQQAVQQKGLGQQATQQATPPSPAAAQQPTTPTQPREVSPRQEVPWMMQDVAKGLGSFFDLNAILQVDPVKDDPAQQAKKAEFNKRFQRLTQEEQQLVQKNYQEEMKRKQQEEQEKQAQEEKRRQQEANQLVVPSSPKKGPVGPAGSGKQKAINKLQQDRQTLGGPSGAH